MKANVLINYIEESERFVIPSCISEKVHIIRYEYKTTRNNEKNGIRYVVCNKEEDAKTYFLDWLQDYNKKNPHRAFLNAKILSIKHVGYADIELY